jgi:MATE family multidrug resistance protein
MTAWQSRQRKEYGNIVFHSVITFMGQSAMQVVDLLFCRNLGSNASATVGTATSLLAWFMIVGIGLVSCLEYFIPNSVGAGEEDQAHAYFYAGLVAACAISLFSAWGLIGLSHLAPILGVNPVIISPVKLFCFIVAPSYFPVFLIPVLRVELQSRGYPHDSTFAFLGGNVLNIFLNWVLVLGHCGFASYGIKGSAIANVLSRFAILFYLVARTRWVRSKLRFPTTLTRKLQWPAVQAIFRMGFPTSLHLLFEMGAFVLVSTIAAGFVTAQNAAHAIVISIASFVFMIPMGISSAAALTISKANGENDPSFAAFLGNQSLKLGMVYAILGSLVLITTRHLLVSFFTNDAETIAISASLMIIVAFFQFGDAMQVILSGCLRGFGVTDIQAKMNAIGHWMIGIPVGLLLAFHFHLQIVGLWIGLCIGLFSVAAGLAYQWRKRTRALRFH